MNTYFTKHREKEKNVLNDFNCIKNQNLLLFNQTIIEAYF